MSPNLGQEAGLTARTVVEAMKTTPALLALVIFNILFMAAVVYIQYTNGERWQTLFELTLKQCGVKQ